MIYWPRKRERNVQGVIVSNRVMLSNCHSHLIRRVDLLPALLDRKPSHSPLPFPNTAFLYAPQFPPRNSPRVTINPSACFSFHGAAFFFTPCAVHRGRSCDVQRAIVLLCFFFFSDYLISFFALISYPLRLTVNLSLTFHFPTPHPYPLPPPLHSHMQWVCDGPADVL